MTDEENKQPLGIKSLADLTHKSPTQIYGEILQKAFTHDWIFSTVFEKIVVTSAVVWAVFCIGNFIYGIL